MADFTARNFAAYRENLPDMQPMVTDVLARLRRLLAWIVREEHRRWSRKAAHWIVVTFTTHPAETQETYLEHLWFTVKTSLRFLLISIVLFTHGVFPFLFKRTASSQVERIYLIIRNRITKVRREEIEGGYDI